MLNKYQLLIFVVNHIFLFVSISHVSTWPPFKHGIFLHFTPSPHEVVILSLTSQGFSAQGKGLSSWIECFKKAVIEMREKIIISNMHQFSDGLLGTVILFFGRKHYLSCSLQRSLRLLNLLQNLENSFIVISWNYWFYLIMKIRFLQMY